MTTVFRILGSISLLSALILSGCGDSASSVQVSRGSGAIERPRDTSAVPVTVAKVERSTIPVQLHAIGAGQAFKTVSVESQVAGIVKEVNYKQGQFVHEGDLLLTLDKRPFVAALDQSNAALSRDYAQVHSIERNLSATKGSTKKALSRKSSSSNIGQPRLPPKPLSTSMRPPSRQPKFSSPIAPSMPPSAVSPELSLSIRAQQ